MVANKVARARRAIRARAARHLPPRPRPRPRPGFAPPRPPPRPLAAAAGLLGEAARLLDEAAAPEPVPGAFALAAAGAGDEPLDLVDFVLAGAPLVGACRGSTAALPRSTSAYQSWEGRPLSVAVIFLTFGFFFCGGGSGCDGGFGGCFRGCSGGGRSVAAAAAAAALGLPSDAAASFLGLL